MYQAESNVSAREALLASGEAVIVCIDSDEWAGANASGPDGKTVGQNNVGKALMIVRSELKAKK